MASPEKIELLYWDGCPSYPEALDLLERVLAEQGVAAEVEVHEVHSHEEAEALHFPGSPTILVDGRDVDQEGADGQPSLSCRIYRLPDGRVSPVPSREQLEKAIA
ncbi:MAG TPA: hypothetical protein VH063_01250 [Gaiellaceae bacterium]|jgi:hypothetical protein|nr:hypothetical protein [Gaiellaceae bacterium]